RNDSEREKRKDETREKETGNEDERSHQSSSANNTDKKSERELKKREPTARDLALMKLLKEEEQRQGELDEDLDPVWSLKKAQIEKPSRQCPYLDTIDRGALDFDFEKLCSVSLSHVNVYACMVCGKYFQVSFIC
ncbi:unnamed protein product, partial [Anisakis simplex]|uniref:U4/U6.U5 tri-snRNP-associated protein 2 (inferred by orthology to a human protein) n=1 Tax=Anisakis simplex TaxID=6269 RepID=A0A0M3JGV8_ANISI